MRAVNCLGVNGLQSRATPASSAFMASTSALPVMIRIGMRGCLCAPRAQRLPVHLRHGKVHDQQADGLTFRQGGQSCTPIGPPRNPSSKGRRNRSLWTVAVIIRQRDFPRRKSRKMRAVLYKHPFNTH